MAYWLLKSEPDAYSFAQMQKDKKTEWTGVRNFQANNHLKSMAVGDQCFFYHSNVGKEVVGIIRVTKKFRLDPEDSKGVFGMVEVSFAEKFSHPVTLEVIKKHKDLRNMVFVKQSRLSVTPVTSKEWDTICALGHAAAQQ